MKTAISIPDSLFRKAEEAAHRLGLTRSRLFSLAIEEFLCHSHVNRSVEDMQAQSVPEEQW